MGLIVSTLTGWFSKYAFQIVQEVLSNYKALTPEQLKALKDQFAEIEKDG